MPTQGNIAHDDTITAIRFPIRLLTLVCLLTIVAFVWFGWILFDVVRDSKIFLDKGSRIEELRGVIIHLDEVLTMSARMAAETGDSRWEERYRQFEPQLDAAIKETEKIETNPSNAEAATKTDEANTKLVEMENRAFALVRAGRKEEAQAILFDPEYETQKQIYVEGITSFVDQLRRKLDESLRAERRLDLLSNIGALVIGGISLVAWWSAARGVREWRTQLLESFHRRADAEENLREAHAKLETRVKERTADLAKTNDNLQAEISERRRAEWQLNIQYTISRVLTESATLKEASTRILQTVCEKLNWAVGEFYTLDRRAGVMRPDDLWSTPGAQVDGFITLSRQTTFVRGIGLPGRVWESGKPIWISDVVVDENFPRVAAAKTVGLHSAFAFPILAGNEVVGVVEFFSREIRRPDEELLRNFAVLASQLGQFFERKRAEEALRESEAHTKAIVQSSLDCIVTIDQEGKILEFNPAAEIVFGYPRAKVLGMELSEVVIPPSLRERHRQGMKRYLATGEAKVLGKRIEIVAMRSDGSEFPVELAITRLGAEGPPMFTGFIRDITESKRGQEALRASEERYRRLFESNPNPMWVFDSETLYFLAVNDAAVRHYGYSQDEFLAMTIRDIRPSDDIPALMDDLSKDVDKSTHWRHCTKDRTLIDVEITSHELMWLGRPARLVLINDITERKKAEETLREQAALFDQTYDAVLVWDAEGLITFWNRGAENLYGFMAAEAVGSRPQQLLHTEITLGLQTVIQSLARHGMWEGEVEHTTSAGRRIMVESRMVLVRDPKREYVLEINRDITERKRGEERLLEQADIINRAHDAIIIRNFQDQIITFWNTGAEHLYGWGAEEAVGKPLGELMFASEKGHVAPLKTLTSTGEFHGEITQFAKNGQEIIVYSNATLIRSPDGEPRSVLLINTDVTGQKKLETQLMRAQRLETIGTLASGVAHDLNNILTPILVCSQALQMGPSEEDVKSLAELMETSAKRGASVVKQVLTFARGVEGERVSIKPSHLIEEMIDIARKTFPKLIEVRSRYSEDLWSIEGDPTQLHQVLLNLSVNARDAMPEGGSLVIAAENFDVDEHYASTAPGAKAGPHVLLRVSDTGSGVPRAAIDKIFDPFFTTKEAGKGTGLGLSTAFGIVKSHGGFISVYSEVGRGTTFKVFLPAQLKELPCESGPAPESLNGHGELVLLVDDEASILRVTKMTLEKKNYQVVSASDGCEALKIFSEQSNSIKAVLTDMDLPHMGGMALAREIKKMKPEMALIASTGQGEHTNVAELQPLGVVNFLTKPYDTGKLLQTLSDALKGKPNGA